MAGGGSVSGAEERADSAPCATNAHPNMAYTPLEDGAAPRLYVRAEPMYPRPTRSAHPQLDSLVYVNDDSHPVLVSNEHFTGHVVVRVRNFSGWTPLGADGSPLPPLEDCPAYFSGRKRMFSMQVSGRFRRQWTGDDVMWGTFFYRPLALPRGSGVALQFAKRIDPSMEYVRDGPRPYVCSPIICAMNAVHIQPLLAPGSSSGAAARGGALGAAAVPSPLASSRAFSASSVFSDATDRSPPPAAAARPTAAVRSSLYETAVRSQDDWTRGVYEPLTLPEWRHGGDADILQENLMVRWPTWTFAPTPRPEPLGDTSDKSPSLLGGSAAVVPMNPRASSPMGAATTAGGKSHALHRDSEVGSQLARATRRNRTSATDRRTWFLDERRRKRFIFHPDTVYSFDFASPYADLNQMQLKMLVTIDVAKYLDWQPVRYECRSRDGSVLFFAIELGML